MGAYLPALRVLAPGVDVVAAVDVSEESVRSFCAEGGVPHSYTRLDLMLAERLLSYVYAPEAAAFEAPKPYLHPLATLFGGVVTDYRPYDHRWHKGVQVTASHLSGQNLWGGNAYVHGEGYLELRERVGSMTHEGFDDVRVQDGLAVLAERLTWRTHDGSAWADERRRIEAAVPRPDSGAGTSPCPPPSPTFARSRCALAARPRRAANWLGTRVCSGAGRVPSGTGAC
jgi:hypothetical protein